MRAHTPNLANVLTDSHTRRLLVDVFHGPDRVMQGLELTDWEIEYDLTRDVKLGGSATVAYTSTAGESLVPVGTEGILSPFKARLLLTMEITAAAFTEQVTIGWARIVAVPSAKDAYADTRFGSVVVSSVVQFEFLGLEENVRRRAFRSPEQPPQLTSTYTELRRITGMTVVTTVADVAIPVGTTYDTGEGGRLKATQEHWDRLGCVGVVNAAGQWVGVPKTPGAPVGALTIGPAGTVIDVGYEVDTDTIYNCVVGTFEDADRKPIYKVAEEKIGPLATTGPYGENTLQYSSSVPTDPYTAQNIVNTVLKQSIGGQTYQVPIKCIANPLVEIGDVLTVAGWVRPLEGRLIKCRLTREALMDVTLEVQRSLS